MANTIPRTIKISNIPIIFTSKDIITPQLICAIIFYVEISRKVLPTWQIKPILLLKIKIEFLVER